MAQTASAAIVGGGIVGASIAHYLAAGGMKDIVLLEQHSVASGATGNSGALVRMHYANPHDAAMALKSLEVFANWGQLIGGDSGFKKTGFLQIVAPHDVENLRSNVAMLRDVGVNTWTISPDEVGDLQPWFRTDDIGAAAYEPDSGCADGHSAATSMVHRARELGVQIQQDNRVLRVLTEGSRVTGVETSRGEISSPVVVLAAGAWSAPLARTAGVDVPVSAQRIAAGMLVRPPELRGPHLTIIDDVTDNYFRPDVEDLTLLGIRAPGGSGHITVDPDSYDATIREEWSTHSAWQISNRIPAMAEAGWRRSWTSVDGFTPDGHMILDTVSSLSGFYVAAGMSGSGFKTGPAVGIAMSELILDGVAKTIDITAFRMSRFQEGDTFTDETDYTPSIPTRSAVSG